MKKLSQRLQIYLGMSAKNDSLLQIKGIVRIYTNSKYLDRNVRWVLFILADYIMLYYYIISFKTIFIGYPAFLFRPSIDMQLFWVKAYVYVTIRVCKLFIFRGILKTDSGTNILIYP